MPAPAVPYFIINKLSPKSESSSYLKFTVQDSQCTKSKFECDTEALKSGIGVRGRIMR
jgi:hypothetical protein